MPRAIELAVLPAPSGRWVSPPPPLTVVEDNSPETWAEFQRLQKAPAPTPQQQLLHKVGSVILDHLEPLFAPGTKFTVIARSPGRSGDDCFVSNDRLDELAAFIEQSKARDDIAPVNIR